MTRLMRITLALMVIGGGVPATSHAVSAATAQKPPKQQRDRNQPTTDVSISLSFTTQEIRILKQHYAPRSRALPPGLQKKLYRTGHLPPGWQKKFEPFPVEVERQLAVLPNGYRRGFIEGRAVIFDSRTQVILDVAVVF